MTSELIGWILTAVAVLIVLLPTLFGLKRGFKVSTFRFLFVLATGLLSYGCSFLISKALLNVNISGLNIVVNEIHVQNLTQLCEQYLAVALANVSYNAELLNLAMGLVAMVLNLICFVILFWALKWLLWPVWAIIAKTQIKKVKPVKVGDTVKNVTIKKRRLLGATMGFAMGVATLIFTFVPIVGISSTLNMLESEGGAISTALGEEYADYLPVYEKSAIGYVMRYTGSELLANVLYNGLTTSKVNDVTINLNNDAYVVLQGYNIYNKYKDLDFSNLTDEQLTTMLEDSSALSNLLESGVVKMVYNAVVPNLIDDMLNNPNSSFKLPDLNNETANAILKNVIKNVKTITGSDLKTEGDAVINIIKDLNNIGLLKTLINGSISFEEVAESITEETANSVFNNLFSSKIIATSLPSILDEGLNLAFTQADLTFNRAEPITADVLKDFCLDICNDLVAITKSVDLQSEIYLNTSAYTNVGSVLDGVLKHKIISASQKNDLLDFASKEINKNLTDENLTIIAEEIINNIKTLESFKGDFQLLGNAVNKAYEIYSEKGDLTKFEIGDYCLVVDEFKNSTIFNKSKTVITNVACDYVNSFVNDSFEFATPVTLTSIQQVITNALECTSLFSEFEKIKVSYESFRDKLGTTTTEDNYVLIGKFIDECIASNSEIITIANARNLLSEFIGFVELPEDIKDVTVNNRTITEQLQLNALNITQFEQEMICVKNILELNFNGSLAPVGTALESLKTSKLFSNIIVDVVKNCLDEQLKTISDENIKTILLSIKDNVSLTVNFKTELEKLESLIDLDFNTASLSTIGKKLDEVKSLQLLNGVIEQLISYEIDKHSNLLDLNIKNVIIKSKQNINQITSYESELTILETASGLDESLSLNEFGVILDSLIPSKLFGNLTNDLLEVCFDNATANILEDNKYYSSLLAVKNNISLIVSTNPKYSNNIYSTELGFVNALLNYTEIDVPTENDITTLKNAILDSDQNSKSILITNEILEDVFA